MQRVLESIRSVRGAVALAAVGFLACSSLVPRSVAAQMLKCDSHSLYRDDEDQLRAVAEDLLPKSARILTVAPCLYLTSARAWIETRKTITTEGAQQWWEFVCWREALKWKCEPPRFKQFIQLSLAQGGQSRAIELNFDKDTTLGGARVLVGRALEIYSDPAARLLSCDAKEPSESNRLGSKFNHSPLPTGSNPIHVTVAHEGKADSVTLDDVAVEIEFPRPSDEPGTTATACWYEVVIVT